MENINVDENSELEFEQPLEEDDDLNQTKQAIFTDKSDPEIDSPKP